MYPIIKPKVIKNYLNHQTTGSHAVGSKEKLSAILAWVRHINVCSLRVVPWFILDQKRLFSVVTEMP